MVGSGPHQENLCQTDPQRTKPIRPQRQSNLPDPEQNWGNKRNREGSVHATQTSQSHSQVGSRISKRQNNHQAMQREIDDLKKGLCHAQQRRSPSSSDISSNEEEDVKYRRRSSTSPSETFSYEEEQFHGRRHKSPSGKGLGNDAMNKALDQICKSPFTHKMEGAKLPRHFH